MLVKLRDFQSYHTWGQVEGRYKLLSSTLVRVYCAPSSMAGVERNLKMGNFVMTQLPCQLKDFSFQILVSAAYNGTQLKRALHTTRGTGFDRFLATFRPTGTAASPCMMKIRAEDDVFDMSGIEEDHVGLETSLVDITVPDQIPDELIFLVDAWSFRLKILQFVYTDVQDVQNDYFEHRFQLFKTFYSKTSGFRMIP